MRSSKVGHLSSVHNYSTGLKVGMVSIVTLLMTVTTGMSVYLVNKGKQLEVRVAAESNERLLVGKQKQSVEELLASASARVSELEARNEYVTNQELTKEIGEINKTFKAVSKAYEELVEFRDIGGKLDELDREYAKALLELAERNYSGAAERISKLVETANKKTQELAAKNATSAITANTPRDNSLPGNGYRRQVVSTSFGEFAVDLVAADLGSTKVIVDTASESSCGNECPVLSLGDYVSRNGAYAGINGSYFCPASYPSCSGKTNSFDTLLMNKNKVYFNSDNNVYSTVPAVIFGSGWVRFVGQSLEWGRDTSIDGMIANQPLLVSGGKSVFGGDGDPKKTGRGSRSFVANKGNTVFIGVIRGVSVQEGAGVLAAMGVDNALNLDSGGSTALWSGGYKVGPGRNIPNAIIFVRK